MEKRIQKEDQQVEIDLIKLLMAYLKKWWLIALCTVLFASAALAYTVNFITPMYRASVMIYVNNIRSGEQIDYLSETNLMAAQQLVSTYANIIESDTVLSRVVEEAGLNYTVEELRGMLTTAQVDETEIFRVYITHPDPQQAAQIANAIARVAPARLEEFVEGSSAKIIDYATVPEEPSSPSYSRNTLLGGVIGCALAVVIITLMFLLDNRIKDEEDLTQMFDLPILSRIPDLSGANMHSKAYVSAKGGDANVQNKA